MTVRNLRTRGALWCLVVAVVALVAAGCGSGSNNNSSSGGSSSGGAGGKKYVLGISNTLVGNGFREEISCAGKAQALASGKVRKVLVQNQKGGAPEQIAAIRTLISAGANAIIANPADAAALDPGLAAAKAER